MCLLSPQCAIYLASKKVTLPGAWHPARPPSAREIHAGPLHLVALENTLGVQQCCVCEKVSSVSVSRWGIRFQVVRRITFRGGLLNQRLQFW